MQKHSRILIAVCLLLAAGCGGTKSGDSGPARAQTKFEFGRSTTSESLVRVIADVLRKYNHQLRLIGSSNFIETEWVVSSPSDLEIEQRITDVRHRVFVSVSSRRAISAASLRLQYEVKYGEGAWLETEPSPEVIDLVKKMQREVQQELSRFLPQW